jgi:LacI family transcriptional regulator
MPVSLVEVSRVSGVSKSTVSRVLNRDPRVSPGAAAAVAEAIAKLGYSKPVGVGRPRRQTDGRSRGTVALLFPDTNPAALRTVLSARLIHGIEEAFRQRGMALVVSGLPSAEKLPAVIEQRQVDGVLIRGTAAEPGRRALAAGLGRLPCVMIFAPRGKAPTEWDQVLEDNEQIGELAVSYLLGRGRKRLGFLNQLPEHPSFRTRLRSYVEHANAAGVEVRSVLSATETAGAMVGRMLEDGVDGLFVPGSDDSVVAVYRAIVERGRKVGRDLDLISCNNDQTRLATLDPGLANIDIQAEAIGRAAVDMLMWRLRHPKDPPRRMSVAPALVETPEREIAGQGHTGGEQSGGGQA